MIIGMLPMSLGLGEGGEQNAPLGRAVIGGLFLATLTTLLFVPVVYSLLRRGQLRTRLPSETCAEACKVRRLRPVFPDVEHATTATTGETHVRCFRSSSD